VLHVHRAERADRLVEALAGVLARPLADPFTTEVLAVPTRGIERWLAQTLGSHLGAGRGRSDGVCANVDFPPPGVVVGGALAAATGIDRDTDPWLPERLVWPLLEVVEACLDEEWMAALAAHLGRAGDDEVPEDDPRRDRRLAALRHLAALYDRYGVHRPAMLRAWAEGGAVLSDGAPLPDDCAWQAELWRRLRAHLGIPSPAERLADACDALRDDGGLSDLPERLSLFGLTRLPPSHLDVLDALAEHRDVHLFVLHPSPALWKGVAASREAKGAVRREEDLSKGTAANRLLRTWGRDVHELQLVLGGGQRAERAQGRRPSELGGGQRAERAQGRRPSGLGGGQRAERARSREHHHPLAETPATLLGHLQEHVRRDVAAETVPADAPPLLDPTDRSLQVHACHGRARQVEVLRDAILHVLAADPTLEPRDVIVLCPDVEEFAPLIHATFGAGAVDDAEVAGSEPPAADEQAPSLPDLRVRLADRALRQTNPVLGAVAAVLDLAVGRVTASQVLDLAGREPVRRRFGFDDDDLGRIEEWVEATGVRWGLDAEHRAPWKVALPDGTWRRGLERVLVGVAAAELGPRLVHGVLPLDDVESGDVDLAGRLAELVDRLGAAFDALSRPQPVAAWAAAVERAADSLLATGPREAWQRGQLQRVLDDLVGEAAGSPTPLTPAELRDLLADRLAGRPTRASFRTGHLTVCTLHPMRSVPHRVVCLLGLDDGLFPRRTVPDGDDLVARDPHVGDRDPRSEDRQLLLDALVAAGDHLIITYAGRDERTNAPLPPAVPVGELLDVVDATARTADGRAAREHVVTQHPLQPFDVRAFAATGAGGPWGFDPTALDGARALAGPRAERPPFLAGPLPPLEGDVVELDALVRFVQHPVRVFLRDRLGVRVGEVAEEVSDALPVELDALEQWGLGDRLLTALLMGHDPAGVRAAEEARGILPPGRLSGRHVDEVGPNAEQIAGLATAILSEVCGDDPPPAGSVEIAVDLPDGRLLLGTVAGVHGDLLRDVTYSWVGAKQQLAAWVRLLALSAAHPERPWCAATVGRGKPLRLPPLAAEESAEERRGAALAHLGVLLDLYDRGMREPLPLYPKTSAAYARVARAGGNPVPPARREWTSTYDRRREQDDADIAQVLGARASLESVLAEEPRPDEEGPGWPAGERSRFGRYALRLWGPVLAHVAGGGA
jgi:exodeoxyribonuclease V gamma subunit